MTTVINSPPSEGNNNLGLFIGIFVLIVLGLVFFYYGLPAIKQMGQISAPQVNVPNKIDVNIKQTP
jgi:hypothetical protein